VAGRSHEPAAGRYPANRAPSGRGKPRRPARPPGLPPIAQREIAATAGHEGLARTSAHAASGEHYLAMQRSVGNAVVTRVLQRDAPQPAAPSPAKPEIKFRFGWLLDAPVETNLQVAAMARLAIASVQGDLDDVDSSEVKAQAAEWIATLNGALPYFDRHGAEPVSDAMIPLINHEYDELVAVRQAIEMDKSDRLRESLRAEQRAAEQAAEQAEALQPALDDAMRSAFRKGSASTVSDTVSTVKSAISIGRNLRTLAAGITTDLLDLPVPKGTKMMVDTWSSQIGRVKVTIVNVNKYTDMLGTLGRGLSAISIALTLTGRSAKATEAEQGIKDLNDAVGISTDLVTLSGVAAPPHFSLYSTLYLKPALKVISKQIGVLVENLSDVNRAAVEVTGDLMYPNAEPGGQEMFDLMIAVMRASDVTDMPALPGGVQTYLYDHRDKLAAGAEEDVPTSGHWFWKDLDAPAARTWLFAHRQQVWAMFYGSMKVPNRTG
jgi:hypothetical protein